MWQALWKLLLFQEFNYIYWITALKVVDKSLISPRSFSRPHFYLSSFGGWLEAQMWFLYHPNASVMIKFGITYRILLLIHVGWFSTPISCTYENIKSQDNNLTKWMKLSILWICCGCSQPGVAWGPYPVTNNNSSIGLDWCSLNTS